MAKISSSPPSRMRSSPTPSVRQQRRVVRQDASSPSMPGQTTESTVVREGQRRSGRDDLQMEQASALPSGRRQLLGVLADVVDRAGEEEGLLGQVVGLALEDLLERRDRVLDRDVLARRGR